MREYIFTSESVSEGHPDKMADQISDAILDAILTQDKHSRVACETLLTTGLCVVAGEITTGATVDYGQVAGIIKKDEPMSRIPPKCRTGVATLLFLLTAGMEYSLAQVEGGLGPSAASVAQAAFYYISKPGEITMSINLWGFVQKPGRYEVPISTDLVQLLSYAGGPIENANLSSVQITRTERRDDAIRRLGFSLDLSDLHRLEPQALTLRPVDTIMIERIPFTWGDFLNVMTAVAIVVTSVTSVLWWISTSN